MMKNAIAEFELNIYFLNLLLVQQLLLESGITKGLKTFSCQLKHQIWYGIADGIKLTNDQVILIKCYMKVIFCEMILYFFFRNYLRLSKSKQHSMNPHRKIICSFGYPCLTASQFEQWLKDEIENKNYHDIIFKCSIHLQLIARVSVLTINIVSLLRLEIFL